MFLVRQRYHEERGRRRGQRELLLADVALAPGSSGGPLANARGQVVGIACMVVGPGMALAVPSHVVRRFMTGLTAPSQRVETEWDRAA